MKLGFVLLWMVASCKHHPIHKDKQYHVLNTANLPQEAVLELNICSDQSGECFKDWTVNPPYDLNVLPPGDYTISGSCIEGSAPCTISTQKYLSLISQEDSQIRTALYQQDVQSRQLLWSAFDATRQYRDYQARCPEVPPLPQLPEPLDQIAQPTLRDYLTLYDGLQLNLNLSRPDQLALANGELIPVRIILLGRKDSPLRQLIGHLALEIGTRNTPTHRYISWPVGNNISTDDEEFNKISNVDLGSVNEEQLKLFDEWFQTSEFYESPSLSNLLKREKMMFSVLKGKLSTKDFIGLTDEKLKNLIELIRDRGYTLPNEYRLGKNHEEILDLETRLQYQDLLTQQLNNLRTVGNTEENMLKSYKELTEVEKIEFTIRLNQINSKIYRWTSVNCVYAATKGASIIFENSSLVRSRLSAPRRVVKELTHLVAKNGSFQPRPGFRGLRLSEETSCSSELLSQLQTDLTDTQIAVHNDQTIRRAIRMLLPRPQEAAGNSSF